VGQDRKLLVENREQMPRKWLGANLFALNKILHCHPKDRIGSSWKSVNLIAPSATPFAPNKDFFTTAVGTFGLEKTILDSLGSSN